MGLLKNASTKKKETHTQQKLSRLRVTTSGKL